MSHYLDMGSNSHRQKAPFCPVDWDVNEVLVICRAKNYAHGIPCRYRYYSSNNIYVMGDVKCKGTERSLS